MSLMQLLDLELRPDPGRKVLKPFSPDQSGGGEDAGAGRSRRLIDRILAFDAAELEAEAEAVLAPLAERHRNVDAVLDRHFDLVADQVEAAGRLDERRRRVIGAYFTQEYAYEAAALFNPSLVLHPDQEGVAEGGVRFVMALRGIGEGHVSSLTFRSGTWRPGGPVEVDAPSRYSVGPIIEQGRGQAARVSLHCGGSRTVSETVLYPILPSQKQGVEDVRLTRFVEEDGGVAYHGTFTAFSGSEARSELLSGTDFHDFEMRPLQGPAAQAKGMALFPRRVDGRYVMLGRRDNENIWLHRSDDLLCWEGGDKLLAPAAAWEAVQIGNCGPPIELDEGWLVLTHGVGAVRTYGIGACLLDRDDPGKVLARTREPILTPQDCGGDGYVPNVVYSCGALVHDRRLLLPYGVSDNTTRFATAAVNDVLAAMS